nr:Uncharacterised protein [Escherichia coli]
MVMNDLILFLHSFFTPSADNMIASWLRQHSDYDGGFWSYWIIPQGVGGNVAPNRIIFTTTQTGYIALKENNAITCAFTVIILNQRSVPTLQELLRH